MDVHNLIFILFLIQIVLVVSEKTGDSGKDIKTLTEKACKFYLVIQYKHHVSVEQIHCVHSFCFEF